MLRLWRSPSGRAEASPVREVAARAACGSDPRRPPHGAAGGRARCRLSSIVGWTTTTSGSQDRIECSWISRRRQAGPRCAVRIVGRRRPPRRPDRAEHPVAAHACVLDLVNPGHYSVFTLYNPFRVVIDLDRLASPGPCSRRTRAQAPIRCCRRRSSVPSAARRRSRSRRSRRRSRRSSSRSRKRSGLRHRRTPSRRVRPRGAPSHRPR